MDISFELNQEFENVQEKPCLKIFFTSVKIKKSISVIIK